MNTESVQCQRVEQIEKVGDFKFGGDVIYIWLPGMSGPDAIRIQKGPPGGERVWGWDGNEEAPTLTPSIHALGEWHGWLRSGKLESC